MYSSFILRLKLGFGRFLECFALERHFVLGNQGSCDYRVRCFKVD
jgi:hypothetical protein